MPSTQRKPHTIASTVNAFVTTCFLLSVILPNRCFLLTKQIGAGRRHLVDKNGIWARRVAQKADAIEEDPFRSYLQWPRLHFSGVFQADTPTRNNAVQNYNISAFKESNERTWNLNGTGAFRLARTVVTSICFPDGRCGAEKELDPIIGSSIEEDGLGTSAKIVDLDPQDMTSTIYGLQLRIGNFFSADFHPSPYTNMWDKATSDSKPSGVGPKHSGNGSKYSENGPKHSGNGPKYPGNGSKNWGDIFKNLGNGFKNWEYIFKYFGNRFRTPGGDGSKGATYHSFMENIKWLKQAKNSPFLHTLREALSSSDSEKLSIRLHVDQYTMNSSSSNFTWGRVVGAIGVSGPRAPLAYVQGRQLEPRNKKRAQSAPFVLDFKNRRVHVDFGNSLPTTLNGSFLVTSLGLLAVGYSIDDARGHHNCSSGFQWLGIVNNRRHDWYQTTAGIQTFPESYPMTKEQMKALENTPLAVAEVEGIWPNISCKDILLEEAAHGTLIHPQGDLLFRRDAGEAFSFDLIVTKFGKPLPRAPVQLELQNNVPALKLPSGPSLTNENGIVSFTIPTSDPKNPRKVIDGQVYKIYYKVSDQAAEKENQNINRKRESLIHVLIWDKYQINCTPTWLQHVRPIFELHAHLFPVMKDFLDLANFDEVIENRKLIHMSMTLPFDHPNYMPLTRDLSNAKRKMILDWLTQPQPLYTQEDDPQYAFGGKRVPLKRQGPTRGSPSVDHTYPREIHKVATFTFDNTPPVPISKNEKLAVKYKSKPKVGESRQGGHILKQKKEHLDKTETLVKPLSSLRPTSNGKSKRLTTGYRRGKISATEGKTKNQQTTTFTLAQLKEDLQTALEVEHATIPPYLTAFSSIKHGHNDKVSKLLKTTLVQEMLHMSLVANLINALGGSPTLTHPDFVPRYPTTLRGGVQQDLVIQLQNLSLPLIKDVFMKIEEPMLTIKGIEYREHVTKHMNDHFRRKRSSDATSFDESYATITEEEERSQSQVIDVHSKENDSKTREGTNQEKGDQEEVGREQEREFQRTEDAEGRDEEWLDCIPPKRVDTKSRSLFEEHKNTIGSFYNHILHALAHITKCGKDNSIFTGDPSRQVTSELWYARSGYGHGNIIKVTDYFSAVRAIREIMEQGEGSSPCMPAAAGVDIHDLSHYFLFYSIYKGRMIRLHKWNGNRLPDGILDNEKQWLEVCHSMYTFDGEEIKFDPAGVWPIIHNPRMSDYIPWSKPYVLARTFNTAYTKLLKSLERAYNGQPEIIKDTMGLMFSVSINAKRLVRMPIHPGDDPDVGPNAAPIYEPII